MREGSVNLTMKWWPLIDHGDTPHRQAMLDCLNYMSENGYRGNVSKVVINPPDPTQCWTLELISMNDPTSSFAAREGKVVVYVAGVLQIITPENFESLYPGVELFDGEEE